jgi:hypothetical protein
MPRDEAERAKQNRKYEEVEAQRRKSKRRIMLETYARNAFKAPAQSDQKETQK